MARANQVAICCSAWAWETVSKLLFLLPRQVSLRIFQTSPSRTNTGEALPSILMYRLIDN
jgi:hypothetical protein